MAALVLLAAPAAGQEIDGAAREPAQWRRWVFGALGAVVAGVPALVSDLPAGGLCSGRSCQTVVAAAIGGGIGYMIGRERDEAIRVLWRVGPDVRHDSEELRLDFRPARVWTSRGGGAVLTGERGIALVTDSLMVERRAGDIRGISRAVRVSASNAVVAGGAAGLFAFPLEVGINGSAIGARVDEEAAIALAALPDGEVIAGVEDRLRRVSVKPSGTGWSVHRTAAARTAGTVAAVACCSAEGVVWVLEGSVLRGRDAATLAPRGQVRLATRGRRLAVDGTLAAIAAGRNGVHLVDVEDGAAPRTVGSPRLGAVRFVAGVALAGERLYVAAGEQGLIVVDVSDPAQPRVVGAARGLGSVDDVAVGEDGVYVVDGAGRRLHRVRLR